MKGIIRDTGLDKLVRILFKQNLALPARYSPWCPHSCEGTSPHNANKQAAANSEISQNCLVIEKEFELQPPKHTLNGLERGVAEELVDWHGPDDPEVLSHPSSSRAVANSSLESPELLALYEGLRVYRGLPLEQFPLPGVLNLLPRDS